MSISESAEGLSVAATRQNAGTDNPAGPPPPRCPPPVAGAAGGVKVPAGTDSAVVMVVLGRETDFRLEQGVVASAVLNSTIARFAIIYVPPGLGQNYHRIGYGLRGIKGTHPGIPEVRNSWVRPFNSPQSAAYVVYNSTANRVRHI